MKKKTITFFMQPSQVACDEKCHKAWGIQCRPRNQLSKKDDDYEWLTDDELPEAPADPGTYEGPHGKPESSKEFPNKWCVRQCERCVMVSPDKTIKLPDFSKRIKNIQDKEE